ncbi:hypothetical protein, conserved [Eimeria praecox]|uniref:Serine aminopeptidase S33 domain-containing protein n=1 Tax=Eimeria praecox TaxID=51316 RepID=U6H2M6_9EIME|nr:hypothetical protein, conserved [Eimeria praecox]
MPRLFGASSKFASALLAVFIGIVIIVGVIWRFQEKLLFLNTFPFGYKTPNLNPRGIRSPAEQGLPFKDVSFTTRDGHKLSAWLLLSENPLKSPTFIFFHGNAGNVGFHLDHAGFICREIGVNVLLLDYRGYGYSEGTPTEEGVYADADAALDFILGSSLVNNKDIFAFGHSLGGAVAIDLASRRGKELKGVVVENTFTSLRDVIHDVVPLSRMFDWLLNVIQRMKLSSEDKVRTMQKPVLFISGRRDSLIPPRRMDQLHRACGSRKKWKLDIPRGEHNTTWAYGMYSYCKGLLEFVETSTSSSTPPLTSNVGTSATKEERGVSTGDSGGRPEGAIRQEAVPCSVVPEASTPRAPERSNDGVQGTQELKTNASWPPSGLKFYTLVLALVVAGLLLRKGINSGVGARHVERGSQAHSSGKLGKPGLELDVSDTDGTPRRSAFSLEDDFRESRSRAPAPTPAEAVVEEAEAAHRIPMASDAQYYVEDVQRHPKMHCTFQKHSRRSNSVVGFSHDATSGASRLANGWSILLQGRV